MSVPDRRSILAAGIALSIGSIPGVIAAPVDRIATALGALERRNGGRLGVQIIETANGRRHGWRAGERFSHCSSFKLSLAAMLLAKADRGAIDPGERLRWTRADMLPFSPVTNIHIANGLSVRELAKATLVVSDNTAANVLLRRFGGPPALTRFWRSLGDRVSRLDRLEPDLNDRAPGSELDTTTPAAMAGTVAALVHGKTLTPASRALLKAWMVEVRTGRERLRAGFPADWVAGDKTGTGLGRYRHSYVDLAFGGPVGRAPLIVAAYYEPARRGEGVDPAALAILAEVGRLASRLG
jgi:beta-lactamase class A